MKKLIIILSLFCLSMTNSTHHGVIYFIQDYQEAFYPNHEFSEILLVSINEQKMYHIKDDILLKTFPISSSKFGESNRKNSFQTPLGLHRIKRKIGHQLAPGTIIINGEPTDQIANILKDPTDVEEDLITSRLLWLDGLEKDVNHHSFERRIYIHGTNEEGLIGSKSSHGCIRMTNSDIISLYPLINEGVYVLIIDL